LQELYHARTQAYEEMQNYLDTEVPKGCPKSNEERAMELMINSGFARAEVDRYRKERAQHKVVTRWNWD
jgi:hypothetical protein